MKNKFYKIASVIMAPLSLMMTIISFYTHNWITTGLWIVSTAIWIHNIKLYWSE